MDDEKKIMVTAWKVHEPTKNKWNLIKERY